MAQCSWLLAKRLMLEIRNSEKSCRLILGSVCLLSYIDEGIGELPFPKATICVTHFLKSHDVFVILSPGAHLGRILCGIRSMPRDKKNYEIELHEFSLFLIHSRGRSATETRCTASIIILVDPGLPPK